MLLFSVHVTRREGERGWGHDVFRTQHIITAKFNEYYVCLSSSHRPRGEERPLSPFYVRWVLSVGTVR